MELEVSALLLIGLAFGLMGAFFLGGLYVAAAMGVTSLILGTFMESYSMLFLTLAILLPPLFQAGVDPFSFVIVLIILVELAQITPPQGLCLFVLQGARRDASIENSTAGGVAGSSGTIADVYIGVLPFIACMFMVLGLLIAFPEIISWLPDLVKGK